MNDKILSSLKNHDPKLCVLATSSRGASPQCAVMGYAVRDDLTLILCTDRSSRKIKNLRGNRKVALTFGWTFEELNVQYEGTAEVIDSGDKFRQCETTYFDSHLESLEFKGIPETIFIEVKPDWYRLSDYTVNPPIIEEQKIA